jgi:hypothetical protein
VEFGKLIPKNINLKKGGYMYRNISGEEGLKQLASRLAGLTTGRINRVVYGADGSYGFARGRFDGEAYLNRKAMSLHDMSGFGIPVTHGDIGLREGQVIVGYHRINEKNGRSFFLRWSPVQPAVANFIDMVNHGGHVREIDCLLLPNSQVIFHCRYLQWLACATLLYADGYLKEALRIALSGRTDLNAEVNDRVIRTICQRFSHDFWDKYVEAVDVTGIHSHIIPTLGERRSQEISKGKTAMGRPTTKNPFSSGDIDKIKFA